MRVAIMTAYADRIIKSRFELIESIINKGHSLVILGCENNEDYKSEFTKYNIDYVRIPFLRSNINPIEEVKLINKAAYILKNMNIDCLLIYGVRLAASIAISAKLAGIKKIYSIINGAGTLFHLEGVKGYAARILSYPLLFTGLRACNGIFFQNEDNKTLFIRRKIVNKNKAHIVNGSGVNLSKFEPMKLPNEFVFLFVGRIIRDKGVVEFIESAKVVKKIYPQARFVLIGPFDQNMTALNEDNLKLLVEDGTIEHITWTNDISNYLDLCYSFVLPSYHEGTPRTVLEAMAKMRPIITTDAPGCRETVIDGVNGFLVPVKNVDLLAEKMIWMIENPEEATNMGQESLRICKERFDVNKVNESILKTMNI